MLSGRFICCNEPEFVSKTSVRGISRVWQSNIRLIINYKMFLTCYVRGDMQGYSNFLK